MFPESYMLVGNFRKLLEIHFNEKHRVGQTPTDNGLFVILFYDNQFTSRGDRGVIGAHFWVKSFI